MSDASAAAPAATSPSVTDTTTAAPTAPAVTAPPAAPTPPAAAAPAPKPPEVQMTSEQLRVRLEEERTKAATRATEEARAAMLKELGVSAEEAKAAIQKAKELEDAQKSEIQKANERASKAEAKAKRADTLEAVVAGRLALEEKALTEDQRAAVKAIAGDDPATRLRTIDALRPTWAAPAPTTQISSQPVATAPATPAATAPTAPAPVAPAAPAPLPAPVSTAPAVTAPAPSSAAAVDHIKILADIEKRNPFEAAAYYFANAGEIDAARRAAPTR